MRNNLPEYSLVGLQCPKQNLTYSFLSPDSGADFWAATSTLVISAIQLARKLSNSALLCKIVQRLPELLNLGKTIETIVTPNNTIDVSYLTKGVYFLQVKTDKGWINKKFIKK